ncbi:MAG: DUF5706 domain-containing protein [Cytophagaceae bacterium]|nr:DUF5706 domain-containing protein [Cytophagaceae bacterium]
METNTGPTPIQPQDSPMPLGEKTRSKPKKDKKDKKKKVSRGVETLFRTTLTNHLKLSEMADQKANQMISINAIIISITISSSLLKDDGNTNLFIHSILLLNVSLITMVIALIATNPVTRSKPRVTAIGSDDPKIDLLFFGDYIKLDAGDYRRSLRTVLDNEELLYNSLIDNIYAQGRVLDRKYWLLKITYRFFMIGFSVVSLSFAITLLFYR